MRSGEKGESSLKLTAALDHQRLVLINAYCPVGLESRVRCSEIMVVYYNVR